MPDTRGSDCGIWPIQIRGWPKEACRVHDRMYTEGSWAEAHMSRADADRWLLTMLLEVSGKNIFKKATSYVMYGVARLFGSAYWEENNNG